METFTSRLMSQKCQQTKIATDHENDVEEVQKNKVQRIRQATVMKNCLWGNKEYSKEGNTGGVGEFGEGV